jgi:hypothetical protein
MFALFAGRAAVRVSAWWYWSIPEEATALA